MRPEIIFCLIFPFALGAISGTYWLTHGVRLKLHNAWVEYYRALEEWEDNPMHVNDTEQPHE